MRLETLVSLQPPEVLGSPQPGDIPRLLREHHQKPPLFPGIVLPIRVDQIDQQRRPFDTYNISAPFTDSSRKYIAARVEPREDEHATQTIFFTLENGRWVKDRRVPSFALQDAAITRIGSNLILGGVKTYPLSEGVGYKMEFYRGPTLQTVHKFAQGPENMKGIRLIELPDGKIGIFTRPQAVVRGVDYGRGQICYTEIDTLDSLTVETIVRAKQIGFSFTNNEWGGANEIHLLPDGRLGVLFHIARFDENGGKHYYAGVFTLDRQTRKVTNMCIIATQDDFPTNVPNKRPDEEDIIYPGGLAYNDNGTFTLYAGLRDTSAGRIIIPDPFAFPDKLLHAA